MSAETVGVVIGTFGDPCWEQLAGERAFPSAARQTRPPDMVCQVHRDTLAQARNDGLRSLQTTWAVCLDADDELSPGYLEAMLAGTGDLRQPSTIGCYEDGTEDDAPVLIPKRLLWDGNYIVIGAMARREMLLDVGGFREEPAFEDWSAWARMALAGAEITACPDAIYRVHVRADSRNKMTGANALVYKQLRDEFRAAAIEKGLI